MVNAISGELLSSLINDRISIIEQRGCSFPQPTCNREPTLANLYFLAPLLPPFPRPPIYHRICCQSFVSCAITFASATTRHVASQSFEQILPFFLIQFCKCIVPIESTFTNATGIVIVGGIVADDIVVIDIVVFFFLCRRRWEILPRLL
jgi:hypothetical protein